MAKADMIEFEVYDTSVAPASRSTSNLYSMNITETLNRTFLVKKMEIHCTMVPSYLTDDASGASGFPYALVFSNAQAGLSVAQMLDSDLDDKEDHQQVIWYRQGYFQSGLVDDADNVSTPVVADFFNTTKTFPTGIPIDKDTNFDWTIFNPSGIAFGTALSAVHLRVRMWGVYL